MDSRSLLTDPLRSSNVNIKRPVHDPDCLRTWTSAVPVQQRCLFAPDRTVTARSAFLHRALTERPASGHCVTTA